MEKSLRKLIQMSWMRRSTVILSNYTIVLHKTSQNCWSSSQDALAFPRETKPPHKNIERFNKFHLSDDYITILKKYEDLYTTMDGKLAIKVLTAVFEAIKNKPYPTDIQKNEQFLNLCTAISKNIRGFNMFELIEVFKIMTYLKVPSQTLLVNTVLQLLTIHVNDLPVANIPFVHFLLLRQNQNLPLVKALLTATPIVFQNQLKKQLDITNNNDLMNTFIFACHNCQPRAVNIITKALLLKTVYANVHNARLIHFALSKLDGLPTACLELLAIVQSVLVTHAMDLSLAHIRGLLTTIHNKVLVGQNEFYHEQLIDALTNAFLSCNSSFTDALDILNMLNNLNYGHAGLLEHIEAKCFVEPYILTNLPFRDMRTIVKAFTVGEYRTHFWNVIRDRILYNNTGANLSDTHSVHFALDVTSLDCYHPNLIKKAFQDDSLESTKEMRDIQLYKLLLLYQSIKTLYPEYDGPWPKTTILQQAQTCTPTCRNESLSNALEWAVGGAQYIRSDLTTKLGHFVDHVIVMQPGGQPVVINSDKDAAKNTEFVEDIQPPPSCTIVLLFIFPSMAYSANYQRLKTTWLLKLRTVKKLTNCLTIGINSKLWTDLPEREKISYIKRAVRVTADDKRFSVICQYV